MLQLISAKKFKVFWCILLQKVLEPADTEEHRLWLSGRAAGFKGGPTDRPTASFSRLSLSSPIHFHLFLAAAVRSQMTLRR